jgi:DNA helicase II / ATP-dependent DNA helicase PcrA
MTALVAAIDWHPVDIPGLEPAAEQAVRSEINTVVTAGPGAGKTELLAQRACYLLQTGLCPDPRRILAISFKRDARKNLKERVDRRCGIELSRRFDSYTFDQFAKDLLDRFLMALPEQWRPADDYEIQTGENERAAEDFLATLIPPAEVGTNEHVRALSPKAFLRNEFLGHKLLADPQRPFTVASWAAEQYWRYLLKRREPSALTFPMISRLAELVLRRNPGILFALRATYSHVFLDEFQDTTYVQYDLLKTAFRNSEAVLTAVGDNKQRIMGWAGAMPDGLTTFKDDFSAEQQTLVMNYRSAPELVRIQRYLIAALDPNSVPPQANDDGKEGAGVCKVLTFPTHEVEAKCLGAAISKLIKDEGHSPRDICIIVKQKPEQYCSTLIRELSNLGIKARVEQELQELLAEPVTQILLAFLKIAVNDRSGSDPNNAIKVLLDIKGVDREDYSAIFRVEDDLYNFNRHLGKALAARCDSRASLLNILSEVMEFIGEGSFKLNYPQYSQGEFYNMKLDEVAKYLFDAFQEYKDWRKAVSDFEGLDSVPIMTIHKSKGLEYDTVIFLGLEDGAFWSFKNQDEEDKRAFFVAFSRAKKRVFFTFSRQRAKRDSYQPSAQSRETIFVLYDLLKSAGVEAIDVPEGGCSGIEFE